MMESEGIYRVKTARNSEEGYRVSLHFKPDIILTDIRMPGRKKRLRNGKGHKDT